ncbi:NAD-dependent epimerase/dehydratase family protein [Nonomuraea sp. NPDC049646]|uniref:NAD-dependent epimerase/dehydratase family protein n=1 Tax=unclassified Nonomuraea TaxID=2593643 RepID=UPI00379F916D
MLSRVLVTGAAGLIGRAVLARCAAEDVPVTALVLEDPGDLKADRVVVGDAGDPEVVRRALDGVDAVIHLAAIPSPNDNPPQEVYLNNTGATFAVLDEAGRAGVRRAVIASSLSVLGMPFSPHRLEPAYLPVDEAHPLLAADPYALSKEADESTARMIHRLHGMTVVALRFPFVGGPEDRLPERAAEFAAEPARGVADLWAYLDSRDAATACWLGVTRPIDGSHVLFVAAPDTIVPLPTEELVHHFLPRSPLRAALPGRAVPIDVTKARRVLGFEAEHLYRF